MALEIKQSLRLSQQLVMTPQLQQAIKLLQLNRVELQEVVSQELLENPVLEELGENNDGTESTITSDSMDAGTDAESATPDNTGDGDFGPALAAGQEPGQLTEAPQPEASLAGEKEDFNWDSYIEEFNNISSTAPSMREVGEELPSFENVLTKTTSLEDHLMWQVSMMELLPEESKVAELIVGNLSDDGYLRAPLEDLAKEAAIPLEDAEEILKIIHNFDPVGVGSRSLQECLTIQAHFMEPRQPLVEKIIENHLPDLERKNYTAISKALNVPIDQVLAATRLILELEPKPGRSFQSNDTQYITPDIYVYKVAEEFVVVLNEDGMPKLRISPYYRNILNGAKDGANAKLTKEYVQEKLRSALWLIKSIHNRQKTIFKVTEAIVKRQRDFFEKGVQHLKPMILRDVANDISMHESTISRVTTNKFVHTPVGIFELKYFFNSSISAADGSESLASEAVKEKIRNLVTKEDAKSPLSDQKIVELLRHENIEIARRTVAKYREMLGILSSGKRKKIL